MTGKLFDDVVVTLIAIGFFIAAAIMLLAGAWVGWEAFTKLDRLTQLEYTVCAMWFMGFGAVLWLRSQINDLRKSLIEVHRRYLLTDEDDE